MTPDELTGATTSDTVVAGGPAGRSRGAWRLTDVLISDQCCQQDRGGSDADLLGQVREVVFGTQIVHTPQRGRFDDCIDPLMPGSFGGRSRGQPLPQLLGSHGDEADRNDLARVGEALRAEHPGRHAESFVGLPLAHEVLEGGSRLEPPDENADDHVISLAARLRETRVGPGLVPAASTGLGQYEAVTGRR